MEFNSSIFLVWILPIFISLYLLTGSKYRNSYLLTVSILLYAWSEPRFVLILLATTCLDFYLVRLICKSKTPSLKKVFLLISITINLGLFFYFKYCNFFIENINVLFSKFGFSTISYLSYALPLGISFYTFETIAYVVDVYRGLHTAQTKLKNYLLYIFLFPKMIAGPIVRYKEIAHQLSNRAHQETMDSILNGFYRFCIGLAKKVLIANQLDLYGIGKLFYDAPQTLNGASAWLGIIGFSMQAYFDFSAYCDMAIGIGKMMGFKLPENFNSPYLSKSMTEFWRRWHITLGNWLRDYIYIPLGGNKGNSVKTYFNLLLIFLLSGVWHGASWNFIIFGLFHGTFLVLERAFLSKFYSKIPDFFMVLFTFLCFNVGLVLFKITDFSKALNYYKALCFTNDVEFAEIRPELWAPLCIAFVFSFSTYFKIGKKLESYFYDDRTELKRHVILTFISLILFVVSLSFNTRWGLTTFIYFRF
jgi:alginate O-acetyltransferase complex protein AlgI